ncbi:hypothetical protein UY3_00563 [Chelonia mydas]|uniref:Uncharacterized protein n=1 Tax=Chelonia mydas TaxID=8469 RepID=M7BWF2_CHEMY|nr:hypothetical protein UY3_00563 [Chelonia mydas]
MLAQASSVHSALEPLGDPAPAKHRELSAPERQARPQHRSSSSVWPPAQCKGRRGRSLHRRLAPPKAPSTDKSGKAVVPALTQAVLLAQAPPSPDLSDLSTDDGLEGVMDEPSTPGTFETTKDLIELAAVSPLPYGDNPPAPMPRAPSRGKPAMVCCSKTPSQHHSQSWSLSSSDSADSHLPAAQKEVAAPAAGQLEEAPGRAHRPETGTGRSRDGPAPEVSRRWSRSRECRPRSWSRGFRYRSRSHSARSRSFSHRRRLLPPPWPLRLASPQSGANSGRYSYSHWDPDSRDP